MRDLCTPHNHVQPAAERCPINGFRLFPTLFASQKRQENLHQRRNRGGLQHVEHRVLVEVDQLDK